MDKFLDEMAKFFSNLPSLVLKEFKEFFKTRTKAPGFYVTIATIFLSFIMMIIYIAAFTHESKVQYYSTEVIVFYALAIIFGIVLCLFRPTSRFAPAAVLIFNFAAFLNFAKYGYMYFTELFYAGINMQSVLQMNFGFMWTIILSIIAFIAGIVAIFLKQYTVLENETNNDASLDEMVSTN